ncbi:hypothetical protein [Streptomyces bottropensis]|uniref:hypothetical protein n=1 Tax=Streptomyces bottropensis TaxID=42235 RepID=UPI00368EDF07
MPLTGEALVTCAQTRKARLAELLVGEAGVVILAPLAVVVNGRRRRPTACRRSWRSLPPPPPHRDR